VPLGSSRLNAPSEYLAGGDAEHFDEGFAEMRTRGHRQFDAVTHADNRPGPEPLSQHVAFPSMTAGGVESEYPKACRLKSEQGLPSAKTNYGRP
jgi:hypothetical protein